MLMIICTPALKAEDSNEPEIEHNNTFFDDHFARDSALVLLNGAVSSVMVEAFCHKAAALPTNVRVAFCQHFAPEAVTFIYLSKSQWPEDAIEVWLSMNMILFSGTIAYIGQEHRQNLPVLTRNAVMAMVYYQAMQIQAKALTRYVAGSNQSFLPHYVSIIFNGISTGLITGGVALWLTYIHTTQYKPLALLMVTPSAALMSVFFYVLGSSATMNVYELAKAAAEAAVLAVAVAGAAVLAVAIAVAGAGAGAGTEAVAVAIAGARAGTGVVVVVVVVVVAVVVAIAGAGAGLVSVVITGCTAATLSQYFGTLPIGRGIVMTISAGLPLMVSFWGVSWQRFVENNVTAHQTMQSEFTFPLKFRSFFQPAGYMIFGSTSD